MGGRGREGRDGHGDGAGQWLGAGRHVDKGLWWAESVSGRG